MPNDTPAWLGKRKQKSSATAKVIAEPMGWPKGKEQRRDYVDAWFYVAAQVAESKAAARVLLAMRKWFDMRTGVCTATNRQLADWAGGLSEWEVSRKISAFAKSGIMIVAIGGRIDADGELRKLRTIHPAYPKPFPPSLTLPEQADHLAPRAQDGGGQNTGFPLAHRAQDPATRAQVHDKRREF